MLATETLVKSIRREAISKAIAAALREAAMKRRVPTKLSQALEYGELGSGAFLCAIDIRGNDLFQELSNAERSAFLYLCSLIAEDDE